MNEIRREAFAQRANDEEVLALSIQFGVSSKFNWAFSSFCRFILDFYPLARPPTPLVHVTRAISLDAGISIWPEFIFNSEMKFISRSTEFIQLFVASLSKDFMQRELGVPEKKGNRCAAFFLYLQATTIKLTSLRALSRNDTLKSRFQFTFWRCGEKTFTSRSFPHREYIFLTKPMTYHSLLYDNCSPLETSSVIRAC